MGPKPPNTLPTPKIRTKIIAPSIKPRSHTSTTSKSQNSTHEPQKWHHSINIDLLTTALYAAFLHPLPAWSFTLILRAVATPYSALPFRLTILYATVVTLFHLLSLVNQRLAYGRPRRMDWESEVVAVTGGASGLGLLIAQVYALRNVPVAVLDIAPAESVAKGMQAQGILYVQCDVGDYHAVQAAREAIIKAYDSPPTILIHAAATISPNGPLLSLAPDALHKSYTTNILGAHHVLAAFLPGMLLREAGGTIVTVSSVLGALGPAGLAPYAAAKAAQVALHQSLTAELKYMASTTASTHSEDTRAEKGRQYPEQIRTVLVTPGHLDTPLFANVVPSPLSRFLGPVVPARELASRIIAAVDSGRGGEIAVPLYARWIRVLDILPASVREWARGWSGMDDAAWKAFGMGKSK